jgi:3-hydroxypropionyl-CoA synthetase (ADP-forming)
MKHLFRSIFEFIFCVVRSKKQKKPIIAGGNGGPYTEKMIKLIEEHNVPVYQDLRTWVAAASALAQWGKVRGK